MSSDPGVPSAAAEERRPVGAQLFWIPVFAALVIWVGHRLGAFDLWAMVTTADGRSVRVPNGFGAVDHPFHAVRAEALRRALGDGELLRWIGDHQGGYPVEFYPLGVAALDVIGWGLAFGSLPMVAVHKLIVIAIFVLPLVGYLLIAGFDRRSIGVALLAGAGHLCVRGWWWSGGSMELVEWGLVTNVAAATALLLTLPLCVRFLSRGDRWAGGLAAGLSAFALVTNPRSGIALAALLVGSILAVLIESPALETVGRRAGFLIALAALLAAPEIVSLIRFNDLYYFVHYSGYADVREFWDSSIRAVGGPFFVLGIAGFVLAMRRGTGIVTRAVAITLGIYVVGTALLSEGTGPSSLIDQLETTRLMPFQRLLWLFLAASAIETTVIWLGSAFRKRSRLVLVDGAMLVASIAVVLLYVVSPPSFIPIEDRGLAEVTSSARPGIVDLEEAVKIADADAPPGTALLVLGTLNTPNSWHDQLWAPLWSDRPFFYDDWLWYWQTSHFGDYNPQTEHAYVNDASALDREYLERHGIGAVVVTGEALARAGQETYLTQIRTGTWEVFRVNDATPIVTLAGNPPAEIDVEEQHISASGTVAGGEILIRRNWYPRWEATINGDHAPIRQTNDGYMAIAAPEDGNVEVDLRYATDWIDWLCRFAVVVGAAIMLVMLIPRGGRFRLRSREPKPVPRVIPTVRSERR
jgi:hypothetical protein